MLGTLLVAAAIAASQPPAPSQVAPTAQQKQQETKANSQAPPNADHSATPTVVLNIAPTQTTEIKPEAKGDNKEYCSSAEWWIAGATVALAVITAALAYFTYWLWKSTSTLVREAKDTARKDLRAYLGVTPQDIKFIGPNHLQAYVEVTNTGKTPAKNVRRWRTMAVREPTDQNAFHIEPPDRGRQPIVPGHKWTVGIELVVTDEQRDSLLKKEMALFVWGRVEYEDCFGERQWLEFRYQNIGTVFVQTPEGQRQIIGWALHPEEDGNEAS